VGDLKTAIRVNQLLPGATGVVTFLPQVAAEVKQVMARVNTFRR